MARRTLYAIGASAVVALLSVAPAQAYVPPPVEVEPAVVEVAGDTLSDTGVSTTLPLVAGASGLILLGGASVIAARRRRAGAIES